MLLESEKQFVENFMLGLVKKNPNEPEFHQAVREVVETLANFLIQNPQYQKAAILERLTEPDRVVSFRVTWEDDKQNIRVNKAYRIQFNNSIGVYKGGMRFHPSVNQSVLKFLGFEQIFKNSLTGLPMGGAKGGSDFDPKGKSDAEVMRFCHSLMSELFRHIGPNIDVPAGDIGVGAREVGYMFGQYKRLANEYSGTFTGKGISYGGSLIRTEATGYGAVYFMQEMLKTKGKSVEGQSCVVSGSGNVSTYCAEKLIQLGAKVVTLSDSDGFIHDREGISLEKLNWIKELKEVRRGRISEYAEKFNCDFHKGKRPWSVPCALAFPCATQNEINEKDAKILITNGVIGISEGANMPTDLEGINAFLNAKVLFGPAKAANAGGVSVSGLEQSQNSIRLSWTREEVDTRLVEIMANIHKKCAEYGKGSDGFINYVKGANIAGFKKVADSMLSFGAI
jgi:glutamate dehydrogenase (NADP+)